MSDEHQVQLPEGVEAGKIPAYPIELETGEPVKLSDEARKKLSDEFRAFPTPTQVIVTDGDRTVEIAYAEGSGYFLLAEDTSGAESEAEDAESTGDDGAEAGGFPTGDAPTNTHQAPADVEPLDGPIATSTSDRISAPIGKRARRMAARERRREEFIAAQEAKQAEEREDEGDSGEDD